MKTQAIYLQNTNSGRKNTSAALRLNTTSAQDMLKPVLSALLPALFILVVTIWAVSQGAIAYVSATFWATGFVFLALVVDARDSQFKTYAYSGVAFMALAWLSWNVAQEFGVVAGFLLSAWVSGAVLSRQVLPTPDPA